MSSQSYKEIYWTIVFFAERCEIEDCPVEMGAFTSFTSVMSVPTRVQLVIFFFSCIYYNQYYNTYYKYERCVDGSIFVI